MLCGSVAVVTGGSRGIGLAVSRSLAESGARVMVLSRESEVGRSRIASLPSATDAPHEWHACNVAEEDEVKRVFAAIRSSVGPIDILVNAAGMSSDALLMRTDGVAARNMMAVNALGPLYTMKAVIGGSQGMIRNRRGSIVNVGSVVGSCGNLGQAACVVGGDLGSCMICVACAAPVSGSLARACS